MSRAPGPSEITRILMQIRSLSDASRQDRDRLFDIVYGELRRLARALMAGERAGQTLSPTVLVHEAYLRLVGDESLAWESRAHFFGIAARAMREILVDQARARSAKKRGGGVTRVRLEDSTEPSVAPEADLLFLHDAMERLSVLDPRSARVAEMRIFGGLAMKEVAHVLGVSRRTAEGDWSAARMWLSRALSGGAA